MLFVVKGDYMDMRIWMVLNIVLILLRIVRKEMSLYGWLVDVR